MNDEEKLYLPTKNSTNLAAKPVKLNPATMATQRTVRNNIKFIKYDSGKNAVSVNEHDNLNLQSPVDLPVLLPSSQLSHSQVENQPLNRKLSVLSRRFRGNIGNSLLMPVSMPRNTPVSQTKL
jgi:hypothetical protein